MTFKFSPIFLFLIIIPFSACFVSNLFKANQIECSVCVVGIELAKDVLKQNRTDQEVINDLQKICNLLNGTQTIQNVTSFIYNIH